MADIKIVVLGSNGCYQSAAEQFNLEFTQMDEADVVLNLAPLEERAAATKAALDAGKHVYSEFPIAACMNEANALADYAQAKGLLLCAGPDVFLGACVQGARRLLEENVIGKPFAAAARLFRRADCDWQAEAAAYITALMNMFGAVKSVAGMATGAHRTGLLRFAGGEVASVVFSHEAYSMPGVNSLEIYGAQGNMALDRLDGTIRIKIGDDGVLPADGSWGGGEWLPIDSPYDAINQDPGIGLADMAAALRDGRAPRAGANQALHALEVLTAMEQAAAEGREVTITTPYERGAMLSLTGAL